jgi:hypothetical protein
MVSAPPNEERPSTQGLKVVVDPEHIYGPNRGWRQFVAVLCTLGALALLPVVHLVLYVIAWLVLEHFVLLLYLAGVVFIMLWAVGSIGAWRDPKFTWLEASAVTVFSPILWAIAYGMTMAALFVVGLICAVCVVAIEFRNDWKILWIVPLGISLAGVAPGLYYVVVPWAIIGVRELLILNYQAGASDQAEHPVPRALLVTQETCMPSEPQATTPLTNLPPGVAEALGKLMTTANQSPGLKTLFSPLLARLQAEAAGRNYEAARKLLNRLTELLRAHIDLERSKGTVQRLADEERLANLKLQKELAIVEKELTEQLKKVRLATEADWQRDQDDQRQLSQRRQQQAHLEDLEIGKLTELWLAARQQLEEKLRNAPEHVRQAALEALDAKYQEALKRVRYDPTAPNNQPPPSVPPPKKA